MKFGVSSTYKDQNKKILNRLDYGWESIRLLTKNCTIDGNEFHQYIVEVLHDKGFHFYQREVRHGSWNVLLVGHGYQKQVIACQNKKWDSVERMLYEVSIFRNRWVEPVVHGNEYVLPDEVFTVMKERGYRYSKNTFMNLWILSKSISPIISKSTQNILAVKLGTIEYEGARV